MRPAEDIEKSIKNIQVNTNAEKDKQVLDDILNTMDKSLKTQSVSQKSKIWRIIMKNNASKLAASIIIITVVLSFLVFDKLNTSAWALSEAIEALRDYKAVYMVGALQDGTAEIWMKANNAGTHSEDVVVKGSHGAITWTKDGSTYHYEPSQNTVYFEHALTVGMSQIFGPELLEMLSLTENTEVVRGKDPATSRDRVTLMCSLIDVHGAQSWIIEFDAESKLPVAMKHWNNLDRSGPPSFEAFKITYYEKLPDSIFEVHIPGNPAYVEKPLTIPDENIGILSNPHDGISVEGMTQQKAAEEAVQILYQAVIDQDLDKLRNISPLCHNLGDDFLRAIVCRPKKDDRITEILEIGQIFKTGHSKLGPLAAISAIVQLQDSRKVEEKMIIQFREIGGKSSCVVHGPYGLPREIE
jgi:hypothetical protein